MLEFIRINDPGKVLNLFDHNTSKDLKHILNSSIVASRGRYGLNIIGETVTFNRRRRLNDIVTDIIKELCTVGGGSNKHVLSIGYNDRPECHAPELLRDLTCYYPNSLEDCCLQHN